MNGHCSVLGASVGMTLISLDHPYAAEVLLTGPQDQQPLQRV